MSSLGMEPRTGLLDKFFWDFTYKKRHLLIPFIIFLIAIFSCILAFKFFSMQKRLERLSKFEPIQVLGIKRDLNIGDIIQRSDFKSFIFYEKEFEKITFKSDGKSETSLILFDNANDYIGRVIKQPIQKDSFLRKEYLAPLGSLPGLINLIDEKHSLVDISVPQVGFNVYIKPGDVVDLYEQIKNTKPKLITTKVKVVLVDSLPLGKAPYQVEANRKSRRQLTLSVSEDNFAKVVNAIKNKSLYATYQNSFIHEHKSEVKRKPAVKKNNFQPLFLIQGAKKEFATK